ncbi:sensor histidine kinase [Pseudodesulfovibrio indicus]|uniref:histidine kinase n=1 Tax=Pseudodesulfovibrio indicus TaxID=1716143 RepID=A0A126QMF1_9BACT|nr:ATP-binding protein [Pseudodesulfovibrio indicus]AMK11260.1 hypothetical protein AWY79_09095 [Pseudodesulfovibrio indicus]TDT92293.1 histidine kinase/DNA gyrase B/HSP90-like ATPase [Pseudodesulfovibrio indicus]
MSNIRKEGLKKYVLLLSIVAISILHFSGLHGSIGLHGIHRELFFIPILLASFWFGLKPGVVVSIVVSAIFIAGIYVDGSHMPAALTIAQIAIFIFVACMLGWLSDHQRRKNEELVEAEKLSILGQTAGVLSWEIKDSVRAIKNLFERGNGLTESQLNKDFTDELDAVDALAQSMTEYVAKESLNITTVDLNDAVKDMVDRYHAHFKERGLHLEVSNDASGCPTKVDPSAISWVLAKLLDNAMDVSKKGNSVFISTSRHGSHCTLEVEDQGVGIAEEHVKKLFTPFFSTKPGGSGISLAACKKTLREIGGDIRVKSVIGSGTSFTIEIPRQSDL